MAISSNHGGTGAPTGAHVHSDDRRNMGGSRGLHNWSALTRSRAEGLVAVNERGAKCERRWDEVRARESEHSLARSHQKQSEAIRSNQGLSEAIRSNQKQSEAIRSNHKQSEALLGNQRVSTPTVNGCCEAPGAGTPTCLMRCGSPFCASQNCEREWSNSSASARC